jgi:hypothetical protein
MERKNKLIQMANEKGISVNTAMYRIQNVLPDGFTYWFGGLSEMALYAAESVKGNFWTPYWEEGIEDTLEIVTDVAEKIFPGDKTIKVLPVHECDFEKAFDLDPDNLTKYMLYEEEQRQRTTNPESN